MRRQELINFWIENNINPHKNKCVICSRIDVCQHQEICINHFINN
jgi:hypothetical protein